MEREREKREEKAERRLLVLYSLPRRQKQQRHLCEIFLQTALYLKVRVGFHLVPRPSRAHQDDMARGALCCVPVTGHRRQPPARLPAVLCLATLFFIHGTKFATRENFASENKTRWYTHGLVKAVDGQERWNGCYTIEGCV